MALGDEGPHPQLSGELESPTRVRIGLGGLESIAMRGYLGENPERQRLEASLLPIPGEVERLPGVLGGLGKMPGQQVNLSELTGAARLIHRLLARVGNFLDESEGLVEASEPRIGLGQESDRGPAHAAPGPGESQAAFQMEHGTVEITL